MSNWVRLKILERIAQQTTNNSGVSAIPATTPPPPAFQASSIYPGIRSGFNAASVVIIDQLCSLLNLALQYSSNGSANFQIFRNNSFNFDGSGAFNVDQKNLMLFSQLVYRTLLNSGNNFQQPLTTSAAQDMLRKLSTSPILSALSQINPTGVIAQKVPGNLKTNILSYLQYLSLANPIAPQ